MIHAIALVFFPEAVDKDRGIGHTYRFFLTVKRSEKTMTEDKNSARFDALAAKWDENPLRIHMVRAVATKIKETVRLHSAMTALEVGCGTGLVTVLIAPELGRVTALDSSEKMLSELQRKIGDMNLTNITCRKGDLVTEEIPESGFDFIYSNMTYHHVADGDALLKKLHRALIPDGVLAIADLDREEGSFHTDMEGVHHLGFMRGEVVSAFERAGFHHCAIMDAHVVEKIESDGNVRRYPMFLATGKKRA